MEKNMKMNIHVSLNTSIYLKQFAVHQKLAQHYISAILQ